MSVKNVTEDEKIGRMSGSLAWRQLRGETGPQPQSKVRISNLHFKLMPSQTVLLCKATLNC